MLSFFWAITLWQGGQDFLSKKEQLCSTDSFLISKSHILLFIGSTNNIESSSKSSGNWKTRWKWIKTDSEIWQLRWNNTLMKLCQRNLKLCLLMKLYSVPKQILKELGLWEEKMWEWLTLETRSRHKHYVVG